MEMEEGCKKTAEGVMTIKKEGRRYVSEVRGKSCIDREVVE